MLIAFHKPYGVLSQFTTDGSANQPLSGFGFPPRVYPLGRLDADSEGLLLLSDEPGMNTRLLDPSRQHPRTYWALVERVPDEATLEVLRSGPVLQGRHCLPCHARVLEPQPGVPERVPPVRFRKSVVDVWLELTLVEGKNRQVRRMTAAVGHPTLRLIRVRIGNLELQDWKPGTWKVLDESERRRVFQGVAPIGACSNAGSRRGRRRAS